MKPRIKLAEATTGDDAVMSLYEHDGSYSIDVNGQGLMHSKACFSEKELGQVGVARLVSDAEARVLVGGLGLGFTLASVLESVGLNTTVQVVELMPQVVEWNHQYLKSLHGAGLDDGRVEVLIDDVRKVIQNARPGTYDAILLDVDNGPVAMVASSNTSLYSNTGVRSIRTALKPGGRVVIWSAGSDQGFERRLPRNGFTVKPVRAQGPGGKKRTSYVIYVADLLT